MSKRFFCTFFPTSLLNKRFDLLVQGSIDVFFIGSGDLSQSMGYPGQQTHPDVQKLMEEGVKTIKDAGCVAGVSCPDNLVPKFLDMGVQYFHGNVNTLIQTTSIACLKEMRQGAKAAGL